jgi:hypothetical protein
MVSNEIAPPKNSSKKIAPKKRAPKKRGCILAAPSYNLAAPSFNNAVLRP